jgi:hypothetical protein
LSCKKCAAWVFGNPSKACNLASSDKHHLLIFFKKKNQSQLLVFDLNLGVLGHPSQARALDLFFYIFLNLVINIVFY